MWLTFNPKTRCLTNVQLINMMCHIFLTNNSNFLVAFWITLDLVSWFFLPENRTLFPNILLFQVMGPSEITINHKLTAFNVYYYKNNDFIKFLTPWTHSLNLSTYWIADFIITTLYWTCKNFLLDLVNDLVIFHEILKDSTVSFFMYHCWTFGKPKLQVFKHDEKLLFGFNPTQLIWETFV